MLTFLFLYIASFFTCAYLDPGTFNYVIQMLLAGILGAGVIIRLYWKKIISFFRHDSSTIASEGGSSDLSEKDNSEQ